MPIEAIVIAAAEKAALKAIEVAIPHLKEATVKGIDSLVEKNILDPKFADTFKEMLNYKNELGTKEIAAKEKGEIGERLNKVEQTLHGAIDWIDQVNYSDLNTKTEKILDAQFTRPEGSTYKEFIPGESPYITEKTIFTKEKCVSEVKNYSSESLRLQLNDASHLQEQISAMQEAFPNYQIELAIPEDTLFNASQEVQEKLLNLHNDGIRIVPILSKSIQAQFGF